MNYEWDSDKNLENIRKHKVGFEQAIIALEDPCRLFFYDEAQSQNEVEAYNENRSLFFGKRT